MPLAAYLPLSLGKQPSLHGKYIITWVTTPQGIRINTQFIILQIDSTCLYRILQRKYFQNVMVREYRRNYLQTNVALTQISGRAMVRPPPRQRCTVGRLRSRRGRLVARVTWTRLSRALSSLLIDVTNERLSHAPRRKTRKLHHTRRNGCTLLTLLQLHQLRLATLSLLYCDPHRHSLSRLSMHYRM